MPKSKELWLRPNLSVDNCPEWSCPTCKNGHLTLAKEDLLFEETTESKSSHNDPEWEPYWISYMFSAVLRCNNSKCRDIVSTCGKGYVEESMMPIDDNEWAYVANDYFIPEHFSPPLAIFQIVDSCPDSVKKEIVNSFSLFFSDTNSCSNKIRIAVELILNDLKIPKTKIVKSRRKRLSLHERIIRFGSSYPKLANALLAIKWIGNAGSHTDTVDKQDLLDAYDILNYTLEEVYFGRKKEIEKMISQINKNKAPRSKGKK